ncbi:glycerate kinase [Streptomyces sp. CB01881]|uniref:glycerate kinase n=1 Tax=Streptomyces sp. CB01881 TaxID=2078691 RepID=UPI000CDC3923|nr:glycerate kinase [Streptomyces sp. CB01881]AUY48897.1 glycerate kinase [Streptomyces sp. CB01881]TYC77387.1 glycerate kinase [Streptomyces sp. CB01881]
MPATPAQGHVVVAPDKFKGTLEGAEVAARIAAGIRRAAPGADVRELPVADGGEGTLAAALAAGFTRIPAKVAGPTGLPVAAALAVRGDTAVVELAQSSGLARLPGGRAAPLAAGSYGVGQLIGRAVSLGAKRIVLGLGGSACTDGGAGMVQALGVSLLDADGAELPPGGAALRRLARLDLGPLAAGTPAAGLTGVEVVVACDVDNPLLGPRGATAVYGPQKGADGDDLVILEEGLTRFADVVGEAVGRDFRDAPGAGAAGGVGFAALALLGATMRPGIELMLELLGFDEAVRGARLVVTGEGCLDAQTLHGKAPAGVAAAAARAGVRVAAVAGRLELSEREWRAAGFAAAYALTDLAEQPGDSMTKAAELAEVAGERLAAALLGR